jgi:hypothetical protein
MTLLAASHQVHSISLCCRQALMSLCRWPRSPTIVKEEQQRTGKILTSSPKHANSSGILTFANGASTKQDGETSTEGFRCSTGRWCSTSILEDKEGKLRVTKGRTFRGLSSFSSVQKVDLQSSRPPSVCAAVITPWAAASVRTRRFIALVIEHIAEIQDRQSSYTI